MNEEMNITVVCILCMSHMLVAMHGCVTLGRPCVEF